MEVKQDGAIKGGFVARGPHRFSEAVVLVDMAILGEQFKAMAQGHAAPDAFRQLPSLDVVHFARLTVLEDDALAAQPQPPIVLLGKRGSKCISLGWPDTNPEATAEVVGSSINGTRSQEARILNLALASRTLAGSRSQDSGLNSRHGSLPTRGPRNSCTFSLSPFVGATPTT